MLKVNSKDTRTTSLSVFIANFYSAVFFVNFEHILYILCVICIVDFEQESQTLI